MGAGLRACGTRWLRLVRDGPLKGLCVRILLLLQAGLPSTSAALHALVSAESAAAEVLRGQGP